MTADARPAGCWVVWVEDLTGEYGGHPAVHLTYVPFGMSVQNARMEQP